MFETLSEKLSQTFRKMKGYGTLNEKQVEEGLREVRLALLEADVNYHVTKQLVQSIRERAVGQEVLESLTPTQQIIKIVHEELTRLMGQGKKDLDLGGRLPAVWMLVGLQGSGKTTTAAKLALYLKEKSLHPYLVSVDVYRPAAMEQLEKLGQQIAVPVHPPEGDKTPEVLCREALKTAQVRGYHPLIVDTAGRLHINEELMQELKTIRGILSPKEIVLVADAMTGQDAVNVAKHFNEWLELTGVILTKMEGDARGGAALSMRAVVERPIKMIGTGEKLDALEHFYPDRMASRILGMGDILTLIEKVQTSVDEKKARELAQKLRKESFNLEDFRDQIRQVRKMGSFEQILGMIPGLGKMKALREAKPDERELVWIEAILSSMTPEERENPRIMNSSRRKRIARGSGTQVSDVNRLLKNFTESQKMIRQMTRRGPKGFSPGRMPF
jgi:signal recognition particle subunit SRP54